MKKSLLLILLTVILASSLLLVACDLSGLMPPNEWGSVFSFETAYAEAQTLGYGGTLAEFIESIRGKDGKDGSSIKSVAVNEQGNLIVTLTDNTVVDCGNVKGEQGDIGPQGPAGEQGETGADGKSAYQLYVEKYGYTGTEEQWLDDLANGRLAEVVEFTVSFDVNGGNETVDCQKVAYGQKATRPSDPTRQGYTFDGWFVDGELWSFAGHIVTEDITLTAQWTKVLTDCQIVSANGFDFDSTAKTLSKTVSNATDIIDISKDIQVSEGCTWKLFADMLGSQEFTLKTANLQQGNNTFYLIVYLNDTFTRYQVNVYRNRMVDYSFVDETGAVLESGKAEETTTLPATAVVPTKEHYEFSHWTVENEQVTFPYLVTEKVTLVPAFTPVDYTITYDVDGGELPSEYVAIYNIEQSVTLPIPTKVGYEFLGWHLLEDLSDQAITTLAVGSYGNKVIYAEWKNIMNGLVFSLNEDGEAYSISGYEGTDTVVDIPSNFNGKPVTSIGTGAFENQMTITDIVLPETITSIMDNAFYGCISLSNINLPSSLKTIGSYAFYGDGKIENIKIPNSVEAIGSHAFYDCAGLQTVTFEDNSQLKSIRRYSFYGCNSLTNIVIPDSVEDIMGNAFGYCLSLTSVTFGENSQLTTIVSYAFYGCSSLTSIVIPDSVTAIEVHVFSGCSSLTNILIPESVTTIGDHAFCDCSSLTRVTFDENSQLEYIGDSAFAGCISLTSIVIPESVTTIGSSAFYGWSSLTICAEIFAKPAGWSSDWNSSNCPVVWDFKEFIADSQGITYAKRNDGTAELVSCNGTATELVITEQISTIPGYIFQNNITITSITLPDSVTSIGSSAFKGCSSLTSVTIPESVTSIGSFAFRLCSSLTSIAIPDSVTTIGDEAFDSCRSLTSIVIPESVTTIGEYAFNECSSLTICAEIFAKPAGWSNVWNPSICPVVWNFKEFMTDEQGITYAMLNDGTATVIGYNGGSIDVVIPSTIEECAVTKINANAFANNDDIKTVYIPQSVTVIESNAFDYSCTSLTVYAAADAKPVGWADDWCVLFSWTILNVKEFYTDESGVKYALINDGTASVVGYRGEGTDIVIQSAVKGYTVNCITKIAFAGCDNLTSVYIPESVLRIGYTAFDGDSNLNFYAETEQEPVGWESGWNNNCPVTWGYVKEA